MCMSPAAWISRALHPQGTISKIIMRPWRSWKRRVYVCERKGQRGREREREKQTCFSHRHKHHEQSLFLVCFIIIRAIRVVVVMRENKLSARMSA